jgi:hypothetical protein
VPNQCQENKPGEYTSVEGSQLIGIKKDENSHLFYITFSNHAPSGLKSTKIPFDLMLGKIAQN